MKFKLTVLIAILVILSQSCSYGIVKKTLPVPVVNQPIIQAPQPRPQTLQQVLANPDKGVHYPQIPIIGYIYQNRLNIGDNLYVRQDSGVYSVFEFTTQGRIRVEPAPMPLIEPVETKPDSTNRGE